MTSFVDMVTIASGGVTICGLPITYFIAKRNALIAEKQHVENFIDSMSKKDVLRANIDDEVLAAVIKSLENIIQETDTLSTQTSDNSIKDIAYNLRLTINTEVRKIYGLDEKLVKDRYEIYKSLQKVRLNCAKTLAFLCASFEIEIKDPDFKNFVLNYAIRPR